MADLGRDTLAVGVRHGDELALSPPIVQTAQFARGGDYEYTRIDNPTIAALEQRVAALEGGRYAVAFASGCAAAAALIRCLRDRGAVLLPRHVYAGTARLLEAEGIEPTRIDSPTEVLASQLRGVMWMESPSNPFLHEVDLAGLRSTLPVSLSLVVDNTMATPALQRPLQLGAQAVVESASKFLGGHSDVIGGLVATNDHALYEALRKDRKTYGACLDPFAAWLLMRGIATLAVRMARSSSTAARLARMLAFQPHVRSVYYPGLNGPRPSAQMTRTGAVVTFRLHDTLDPDRFANSLALITPAASYGSVESLINQCATMSHGSLSADQKQAIGLDDHVFRLSVGLENRADLEADLRRALATAARQTAKRHPTRSTSATMKQGEMTV